MGRASRTKREKRRRVRLHALQRALLIIDADERSPCAGCAFTDPEAFASDPAMGRKLLECLRTHDVFWCHHDSDGEEFPSEPGGTYQKPPQERMVMCAGYAGFYRKLAELPREDQEATVAELEKTAWRKWCEKHPEVETLATVDFTMFRMIRLEQTGMLRDELPYLTTPEEKRLAKILLSDAWRERKEREMEAAS